MNRTSLFEAISGNYVLKHWPRCVQPSRIRLLHRGRGKSSSLDHLFRAFVRVEKVHIGRRFGTTSAYHQEQRSQVNRVHCELLKSKQLNRTDKIIRLLGMGVSLFEWLDSKEGSVELVHQYRMNQ